MLFQKLIIPNMVKAVTSSCFKKQMLSFSKSPYAVKYYFNKYYLQIFNSKWKIYFLYHYRFKLA